MFFTDRNKWLSFDDDNFLTLCELTWFQASGPGGQKRNRKYSAVRLKHLPTGLVAEEVQSRSQNINKHNAVKKLKIKLATECEGDSIDIFRINTGVTSKEYPVFVAKLFDSLKKYSYSVSDAANSLNISTSKMIKLLFRDEQLWRFVNAERQKTGLIPLKSPK